MQIGNVGCALLFVESAAWRRRAAGGGNNGWDALAVDLTSTRAGVNGLLEVGLCMHGCTSGGMASWRSASASACLGLGMANVVDALDNGIIEGMPGGLYGRPAALSVIVILDLAFGLFSKMFRLRASSTSASLTCCSTAKRNLLVSAPSSESLHAGSSMVVSIEPKTATMHHVYTGWLACLLTG
jgi:hypothetical protein